MGLPLEGVRVMVTRAAASSDELVELLQGRGATVTAMPLIRIGPPPDMTAFERAVDSATTFAWLIFTSANAVEAFVRCRKAPLEVGPQIAAVGPVTSEAVARLLKRPPQIVPARFASRALADAVIARTTTFERLLVLQAADASPVLVERLQQGQRDVTAVAAYATQESPPQDLRESVASVDVITLASGSAVRSLVRSLGPAVNEALRGKLMACIGPVTEIEARRLGLHVELVPPEATCEALVDELCRYYRA